MSQYRAVQLQYCNSDERAREGIMARAMSWPWEALAWPRRVMAWPRRVMSWPKVVMSLPMRAMTCGGQSMAMDTMDTSEGLGIRTLFCRVTSSSRHE